MPSPSVPSPQGVECPPTARSHAYLIRLSDCPGDLGIATLAGRLEETASLWWAGAPERRPRLWCEAVRHLAGTDRAERLLRRELHRPVDETGPALRAVLLRYADGVADLVLVARREVLDPESLRLVARTLTGDLEAVSLAVPAASPATGRTGDDLGCGWHGAVHGGRVEWATPDAEAGSATGMVEVALADAANDAIAHLAVAAGLVLSRYEPGQTPVIVVPAIGLARPERALGAFGTGALLTLDTTGPRKLGELLAIASQALENGGPCAPGRHTDGCAAAADGVTLGILSDALDTENGWVLPAQSAPWPLTLVPRGRADGKLSLEVHHRLRKIDDNTARRFARHLAHIYRQVCDGSPDLLTDRIDVLDEAEAKRQLALGLPATAARTWQPQRIDTAFEACAAQRPDAVAVVCGEESLTYRTLDGRAARLATGLAALGAEPGDRIGVCLERSPDLVTTLLAVLKADAVYVPLDPAHPADRLAHTVEDAGLRLVVTDVADFPGAEGTRLFSPAELAEAARTATPAAPARGPEAAAYVIYTSGSSGRPKGVVVPHRNVLALLAATREDFGLGSDDTWTLFHSSAFDFSVWEMWGALLTGARLVVVPYWVSRSPEDFHALILEEHVTVLSQTPSAFAQLMEADRRAERALPVRLVVFGGEPLDTCMLRDWFDRYPEHRCRLVNMFGITETTVHVTAQTVTRHEAMAGSRSVGRPLPGWYVRILDEQGRPVPRGVSGEIYVGGEGVAQGYLGRPELTAERFVTDPHSDGRMYRSGDRGRFLPDGRIEHLGRLDNQVKVRGFRIELDEIRAVLLDDPTVVSAAVILRGAADGDAARTRIDAYLVLNGEQSVQWAAALRTRAARLLPDYMVPATLTAVSELPLTANGKLDAGRLLELVPATILSGAGTPSVRPGEAPPARGDVDGLGTVLAEVWEHVLGVPVGLDDNFFELGGNSLYAVRIRTAMQERGMPELTLRQLYLTPTVRGLATVLRSG